MTTLYSLQEFKPEQLTILKNSFPHLHFVSATENRTCPDAEIIIGWQSKWNADFMTRFPHLKWVQSISAGVDKMPLAQFKAANILLSNTSGIHAQPIAETVFGYLFAFYRGLYRAHSQQRQHQWRDDGPFQNLTAKKIIIFGTGHIGQKIAEYAQNFGMQTIGVNHSGHPAAHFAQITTHEQLLPFLKTSDIVVNALPLTATTENYFSTTFFKTLNSQATFINIGRGASVDEQALMTALKTNELKQAALDVVSDEPLAADSPLWTTPNLIITPHTAGQVEHFKKQIFEIFLTNLTQFQRYQTLAEKQVDLGRGY